MKTKTILSTRLALALYPLTPLAAIGACAGDFTFEEGCPEGTTQVAGGGDVKDPNVCRPNDQAQGSGGSSPGTGGAAGAGGVTPSMGSGGGEVPSGGQCAPKATKCEGEAQQTCGADGQWGEAEACDIACDSAGSQCVVPVQLAAGSKHICTRLSDGTARCWGFDAFGQLGNGPGNNSPLPNPVLGLTDVASLRICENFSCAILADRTVSCWGESFFQGAQATIHQEPVPIGGALDVEFLGVANTFLCIGKRGGALRVHG